MKRVPVFLCVFGFLFLTLSPAFAADTKWVRGTVSAVSGDSVTVKVQDKDMTFKVDSKTDIVAPGGGTATRQAQAAGKPGVELATLFKAGDRIEVHYNEADMKAVEIRRFGAHTPGASATGGTAAGGAAAGATGGTEAAEGQGKSARGTVTAVGADSITVKGDAGEWTFHVDAKTRFIGRGLSTATRQAEAKGAPGLKLSDTIKMNDRVVVSFQDMGGKMHASEVRIIGR